MGLRVYETFGFQGLDKVAEEKERQGWRVCGEVGGGAAAAYISQCTQKTGHLIYSQPHGSSCYVVFTVVLWICAHSQFVLLTRLSGGRDDFHQG